MCIYIIELESIHIYIFTMHHYCIMYIYNVCISVLSMYIFICVVNTGTIKLAIKTIFLKLNGEIVLQNIHCSGVKV